jgi:hypothetical protein
VIELITTAFAVVGYVGVGLVAHQWGRATDKSEARQIDAVRDLRIDLAQVRHELQLLREAMLREMRRDRNGGPYR